MDRFLLAALAAGLAAAGPILPAAAKDAARSAGQTTSSGPGALTLAALVGEADPLLSGPDKRVLQRFLDGEPVAADAPILHVRARSVLCRKSNVDLTSASCELRFGKDPVTLTGRRARELGAALTVAGADSDGAAGTIYTGAGDLACTLAPRAIAQRDGGGADCRFGPSR